MCYLITIILIILSLKYRTNNKLFIFFCLWLWILYTFSGTNADFAMYKDLYIQYGTENLTMGNYLLFKIFCKMCYILHCPYNLFLGIYSGIGLSLIGYIINKYAKEKNIVLSLYAIFPFVFYVIQLKNFMAMAVIIFAVQFLIKEGTKKEKIINYCIYIILNLIAIGFHTFAAVCLPFVVIAILKEKKVNIICLIITITMVIIEVSQLFIPILSLILPEEKVKAYFVWEKYRPGITSTIKSIIFIVLLIAGIQIFRAIKNREKVELNNIDKFTIKLFNCFVCLIPAIIYLNQFMRLPRSLLVLYYIMAVNSMNFKVENLKSFLKNKNNIIIGLFILSVIFINYQTDIFSINNQEATIQAVFEKNLLFNIGR